MAITPASAGWRYVGFEVMRLARGEELRLDSADRELCLVVLGGSCAVRTPDQSWEAVGERASVFDGPPAAVYLAPRTVATVSGRSEVEIALGWTRASHGATTRVLRPAEARLEIRGTGATERRIHHVLMEDQPAEALLVTEVVTPAGHWSSFPPHKHDTDDPPRETALEETYYHRLRDPRGFALQRVYTADRALDESITVRDGDLVLVPRGYHTVSAAPGYELYYLNVMAGPVRRWCITFDPEHAWLRT
jgi:5-deoxy-glucuronate isomerase